MQPPLGMLRRGLSRIVFAGPQAFFYTGKAWVTPLVGGRYLFVGDGARLLDARTLFFYNATGVTPAMALKMVGIGFAVCSRIGGRRQKLPQRFQALQINFAAKSTRQKLLVRYGVRRANAIDGTDGPAAHRE